jgi:hypothetical protein
MPLLIIIAALCSLRFLSRGRGVLAVCALIAVLGLGSLGNDLAATAHARNVEVARKSGGFDSCSVAASRACKRRIGGHAVIVVASATLAPSQR